MSKQKSTMNQLRVISESHDGSGRPFSGNLDPEIKFRPLPQEINGPKYLFRYISIDTFVNLFYLKHILFRSPLVYMNSDSHECSYPYQQIGHYIMLVSTGGGQTFNDYHTCLDFERGRFFLSCWYGSDSLVPSRIMRNAYHQDGVVVVFEREKLLDALMEGGCAGGLLDRITNGEAQRFDEHLQLSHGWVEYYDEAMLIKRVRDMLPVTHPAFAKRMEFQHEKEYRFVIDIGEKLSAFKQNSPKIFDDLKPQWMTCYTDHHNYRSSYQSIWVSYPYQKSLNDIGLIKAIACSETAYSILTILCRQREVRFEGLRNYQEDYTFVQKKEDAFDLETWANASNPSLRPLMEEAHRIAKERAK